MIKAVIFDCFGVLTESTHKLFYKTYFAEQPEKVEQALLLDDAANKGNISLDEFHSGLAELAGISEREVSDFVTRHLPNEDLLVYIQNHLKPGYKIGFLSNVADDLMDVLFTREQQALFDDVILSFQVGMTKPQTEIYKLSANRLGVEPKECVFVDDVQKYIDGAKVAGMQGILYTDFDNFKQEIEKIL